MNQKTLNLEENIRNWARSFGLKDPIRQLQRFYYLRLRSKAKSKEISAMIRIKNEEDFLSASVLSIVDYIDEIVIVNNLSTDRTPDIICDLVKKYPDKMFSYEYPYEVGKMGQENWNLIKNPLSRNSPRILSNYYNWCLKKCRKPYILKWDGDMIATESFCKMIAQFKESPEVEVVHFAGANIHPDLEHYVASDLSKLKVDSNSVTDLDQEEAIKSFANYLTPITEFEPRLFPKKFAVYKNTLWYCEQLSTPFVGLPAHDYTFHEPCYLHMKFCKSDPWLNFSEDFKTAIRSVFSKGLRLKDEMHTALNSWQYTSSIRK